MNKSVNRALFKKSNKLTSLILFLLLSALFLVFERTSYPGIALIRATLDDLFAPPISGVNAIMRKTSDSFSFIGDIIDVYEENERLNEEVSRLEEWRSVAERLALENQRLIDLLQVKSLPHEILVSPRVISLIGGAYARSALVNSGRNDGVESDLTVVDGTGLIGRTIHVGFTTSEVLLLTDINSRIPVRVERSGDNGIAIGTNNSDLRLAFLPLNPDIQVGDRILTSGDGGIFRPDLVVGTVTSIEEGTIHVTPQSRLSNLNFVSILKKHTVALVDDNNSNAAPQDNPENPANDQREGQF